MCVEVTGDRGSWVAFLLSMGIAAVLGVDILGGLSRKVLRMEIRMITLTGLYYRPFPIVSRN